MLEKTSISTLYTAENSPIFTFDPSFFSFDERCYDKITPSIPEISFLKSRPISEKLTKEDAISATVTFLASNNQEEAITVSLPNRRALTDEEILSSGKSISLSTLKSLRIFSEFNSEENLSLFLEVFFFGKKGEFDSLDLNPKETLLLKGVLLQRIPSKHNRWLINMIKSLNNENYKQVMKMIEGHIILHRNNICEHFIFCKLIAFCQGKSEFKVLSSIELPANKLLTSNFLKSTFSVSGFKDEFKNVCSSEKFRQSLIESSKKNFRLAAKGLLFAAELSLEKPELNICPKVNLGVTAIQVESINAFFRKYLV